MVLRSLLLQIGWPVTSHGMAVWKRRAWQAAVVALWMVAWGGWLLGGCSEETRYSVLSFLFEGVPSPGQTMQWEPVVRNARRPPPPRSTPAPTPQVIVIKEERPPDWLDKLLKTLPQDDAGIPDMTAALNKKLIQPQAGIKPETKPQSVMSMDVKLAPMPVVFSHKAHTAWLACTSCHPALFKMKAGADKIKMADLYTGKYCGKCHAKVAFPVTTGCGHCHQGMPGGAKAATAKAKPIKPVRGDITIARKGAEQGGMQGIPPAVFPHLPHRVLFRCYVCHEPIFKMQRGADAMTMDQITDGKYCGACHNGKTAFASDNLSSCSQCHRQ